MVAGIPVVIKPGNAPPGALRGNTDPSDPSNPSDPTDPTDPTDRTDQPIAPTFAKGNNY
jgi:hypothetical protein